MHASSALDQLHLLVIVDNETDTLSSIDPQVPQRSAIAGLLASGQPSQAPGGHPCMQVFDRLCSACHGFSVLATGMEDRIPQTVADLVEKVDPTLVGPGHCTGWRAKVALAAAFAPERYAPSVVGSRYVLRAI